LQMRLAYVALHLIYLHRNWGWRLSTSG